MFKKHITKLFSEAFVGNDKSPMGVPELADRLGKATSSLYGELDPQPREGLRDKGKLSVDTAFDLMDITGIHAPLIQQAHLLGYRVIPLDRGKHVSPDGTGPFALMRACTHLLEIEQDSEVNRLDMMNAANAVIEEAEAIVYRRFPDTKIAFGRLTRQSLWQRLLTRLRR